METVENTRFQLFNDYRASAGISSLSPQHVLLYGSNSSQLTIKVTDFQMTDNDYVWFQAGTYILYRFMKHKIASAACTPYMVFKWVVWQMQLAPSTSFAESEHFEQMIFNDFRS